MEKILFSREWAMPSAWTFTIKPIKKLIDRYVGEMCITAIIADKASGYVTN